MLDLKSHLLFLQRKMQHVLCLCCFAAFIAPLIVKKASGNSLDPGTIFKDCTVCPEMIVIPRGGFKIGSIQGNQNELPTRNITIAKPYAIGRFEITFDEWDACHAEGGCSRKPHDRGWGRVHRPVINVLYADIQEYLFWISNKTKHIYRLPSEAEWEYAARATTTTEYWWGNRMIKGNANCRNCGTKWGGKMSAPVGSFKENPWGLYDMHGNLLEYVEDCWTNDHESIATDASPIVISGCLSRVIKGGAWYYLPRVSRSAYRARNDTRIFSYVVGFRALRVLE